MFFKILRPPAFKNSAEHYRRAGRSRRDLATLRRQLLLFRPRILRWTFNANKLRFFRTARAAGSGGVGSLSLTFAGCNSQFYNGNYCNSICVYFQRQIATSLKPREPQASTRNFAATTVAIQIAVSSGRCGTGRRCHFEKFGSRGVGFRIKMTIFATTTKGCLKYKG